MTWLYAIAPAGVTARRVTSLPAVDWYMQQTRLRVASIACGADGLGVVLDPIYAFRFAAFLPQIRTALRRCCAQLREAGEQRCDLFLVMDEQDGWVLRTDYSS